MLIIVSNRENVVQLQLENHQRHPFQTRLCSHALNKPSAILGPVIDISYSHIFILASPVLAVCISPNLSFAVDFLFVSLRLTLLFAVASASQQNLTNHHSKSQTLCDWHTISAAIAFVLSCIRSRSRYWTKISAMNTTAPTWFLSI